MQTCKKPIAVVLLGSLLMFSAPASIDAGGLGLSFDIISVGPISLGVGIPVRAGGLVLLGGAFLVGKLVTSFFGRSSRRSYRASHPTGEVTSFRVTISPDDNMPADVMEIKFADVFRERRLDLPRGYVAIQDDGRMVFHDAGFEGYMYLQYDRTLTVWDTSDNPVVVITRHGEGTLLLCEEEGQAARVLESLMGEAS